MIWFSICVRATAFPTKLGLRNLAPRFLCGYGAASPLKRTGLTYLSWSAPGRPSICRPVGARLASHTVFGWARASVESHVQFCEGFLRFELAQRKNMRFPNAFAQRFLGQTFCRATLRNDFYEGSRSVGYLTHASDNIKNSKK